MTKPKSAAAKPATKLAAPKADGPKAADPAKVAKPDNHGSRIDAIVAVLKANGMSLPKDLG